MAQADFMRFIEKRLAQDHQVFYTTHSPFMVDTNHPNRIQLVEDLETTGTIVSGDIIRSKAGRDTVFPLMAAMGIDITQTLFVGPNTLLVEGPSELLYFPALTKWLHDAGRMGLDPRWTITPINGIDKAPAFVSLFGANKLNLAVVMDYEPKQKKLLDGLRSDTRLGPDRVIAISEILQFGEADTEDLFDPTYYLRIVNGAYQRELRTPLKLDDIKNGDARIVKRLGRHFEAQQIGNGSFGHAFVAEHLVRNLPTFQPPPKVTLDRFEALFKRLNGLLDQ
jgi:hypothetical protein